MFLLVAIGLVAIVIFAFTSPEGFWSNTITLINVVLAAMLAMNYFEPVAAFFDTGDMLASFTYLLDIIAIWAVFAIAFSLLRFVTDSISRTRVRFRMPVETIGNLVMCAAIAWVMVSFTMTTFHLAPLARTPFQGAFQETPMANNLLGLAPDRMWLGFFQHRTRVALSA